MLHTVWKSTNFLPLRFCVKSIFEHLEPFNLPKMVVIEALNLSKLISRKILLTEEFLDFHTVELT